MTEFILKGLVCLPASISDFPYWPKFVYLPASTSGLPLLTQTFQHTREYLWLLLLPLICVYLPVSSGGSSIFPRGVRQLPKVLLFFKYLPKTAWKWKNLDPGGASLAPPLDPPMVSTQCSLADPVVQFFRFWSWLLCHKLSPFCHAIPRQEKFSMTTGPIKCPHHFIQYMYCNFILKKEKK